MVSSKRIIGFVMMSILTMFIAMSGVSTSASASAITITKKFTKGKEANKIIETKKVAREEVKRKATLLRAEKKLLEEADKAVKKAEKLTDVGKYNVLSNSTDIANAQSAVKAAVKSIVKLGKKTPAYKKLMARVDDANSKMITIEDDRESPELVKVYK